MTSPFDFTSLTFFLNLQTPLKVAWVTHGDLESMWPDPSLNPLIRACPARPVSAPSSSLENKGQTVQVTCHHVIANPWDVTCLFLFCPHRNFRFAAAKWDGLETKQKRRFPRHGGKLLSLEKTGCTEPQQNWTESSTQFKIATKRVFCTDISSC